MVLEAAGVSSKDRLDALKDFTVVAKTTGAHKFRAPSGFICFTGGDYGYGNATQDSKRTPTEQSAAERGVVDVWRNKARQLRDAEVARAIAAGEVRYSEGRGRPDITAAATDVLDATVKEYGYGSVRGNSRLESAETRDVHHWKAEATRIFDEELDRAEAADRAGVQYSEGRGRPDAGGNGRDRGVPASKVRSHYGEARDANAVSAVGVHYSRAQRSVLSSAAYRSGLKGAEWKRVIARTMPELDVSHLDDTAAYYKSGIVKRPDTDITAAATDVLDASGVSGKDRPGALKDFAVVATTTGAHKS